MAFILLRGSGLFDELGDVPGFDSIASEPGNSQIVNQPRHPIRSCFGGCLRIVGHDACNFGVARERGAFGLTLFQRGDVSVHPGGQKSGANCTVGSGEHPSNGRGEPMNNAQPGI